MLNPGLAWLTKKWCGSDPDAGGYDPEDGAGARVDFAEDEDG